MGLGADDPLPVLVGMESALAGVTLLLVALEQLMPEGTPEMFAERVKSAHWQWKISSEKKVCPSPRLLFKFQERLTWYSWPSPPSKTSWMVTFAPSWTPLMLAAARSIGIQNAPSPVVWKYCFAMRKLPLPSVKSVKVLGSWSVEMITPTTYQI